MTRLVFLCVFSFSALRLLPVLCACGRVGHVARTRNEHPRSAGEPTPLPRISTLCVLPRPPGMTSVLRCRDSQQKIRLVEEAERLQPFTLGRSEERRVGKECRARWSPHHTKEKQHSRDMKTNKQKR